jgi:hypothetical protein
MKYGKFALVLMLIGVLGIIATTACSAPVPPAQFEVAPLNIQPRQVLIGETFKVSTEITNSGGTPGFYSAVLSVDGEKVNSKTVSVSQGSTEMVSFLSSLDKAGTYKIAIGDSSVKYTVNPKMSSQPIELKYDDGNVADYLAVDKPCTGYLISYDSPSNPFTINAVKLFGLIYGGHGFMIKDVILEIWGKDKKVIYKTEVDTTAFNLLAYLPSDLEKQGAWATVSIPDIKLDGTFYVHVFSGTTTGQGFRMGADDRPKNTHSEITIRDSNGNDSIATTWNYPVSRWFGDKSRVTWMIRVSGIEWKTEE